jgi:hypothetical protein
MKGGNKGGSPISGVTDSKVGRGNTIRQSGPPDQTASLGASRRETMGGSTTNLSHSLTGVSAKQTGADKSGF